MGCQLLLNQNLNGRILKTNWVWRLRKKVWQNQNSMLRMSNSLNDSSNDFEFMHISLQFSTDRSTNQTLILKKRSFLESEWRKTKWKKKRRSILMKSFEFDSTLMEMDFSSLMRMLFEFITESNFFNTFERHWSSQRIQLLRNFIKTLKTLSNQIRRWMPIGSMQKMISNWLNI